MEDLIINEDADLAGSGINPRKYSERTVGPSTLAVLWFGMAVQLAIFMAAGQLFPALTGWEVFAALLVAYTIVAVIMWYTQDLGIKYGIPFAVSMRPSFGYNGTHLPAYLRAIPAMFWFGFQTWIAALAISQITDILFGWSNLYLYITLFGALQILTTYFGIRVLAWFNWVASPILFVIGIYMLTLLLKSYNATFGAVMAMGGKGGLSLPLAAMMLVGGWATMAVSIQDITRECKVDPQKTGSWWECNKKYLLAQWLGMVPASIFFGLIGFVSNALTGDWNPITVITTVIGANSPALAIICLLFIVLATWSTNAAANLLPPAYVFSNTWPTTITFGRGAIIAGIVGLLMQPWRAAPTLVVYLSMIAGALAPVAGILVCDYFFLRRRQLDLNALYTSRGHYRYRGGWNPAALIAYAVAVVVSIPLWNYMYVIGIIVSGVVYYVLMKYWIVKTYPQRELEQEAVSRAHLSH